MAATVTEQVIPHRKVRAITQHTQVQVKNLLKGWDGGCDTKCFACC